MLEVLAIVVPVGIVGIGGYVHLWVKNNVNEANITSIKDLIEAKLDGHGELITEKLDTVGKRLDRIERSMNGHLLKE